MVRSVCVCVGLYVQIPVVVNALGFGVKTVGVYLSSGSVMEPTNVEMARMNNLAFHVSHLALLLSLL